MRTLAFTAAALFLSLPAWALPPTAFQGKPDFSAAGDAGAFVWKDKAGLHVRFSTRGTPRRLHGKVCTPGRTIHPEPVRADYGDRLKHGPKKHCVMYDFLTADGVDGFDFRATGGVVEFDFHVGDKQLPTEWIHVGKDGTHPTHSPFVLNR